MDRDCYRYLDEWKSKSKRKPLLLLGARQVGKSWLSQKLGETFENYLEVNFEEHSALSTIFDESLSPEHIILNLENYFNIDIIPGKTLVFFDEIQEVPKAIVSLRYFYEKMNDLHVVAAGSLLEFELDEIGFPVGRLDVLQVFPLSFGEFLEAMGESKARKILAKEPTPVSSVLHSKYLKFVRDYTLVGGMPEVVNHYSERKNINECVEILESLVQMYRRDFSKYANNKMIINVETVFDAIPRLTGTKFKWSNITTEVKSGVLNKALDLLVKAGLAYKVYHSSSNGVPLKSQVKHKKFKVLFFDLGLASRILDLDIRELIVDSDITLINKGDLAELFVGLELRKYSSPLFVPDVFYWQRESRGSSSEVDYIVSRDQRVIPIEVKSGNSNKMKSLKIFMSEKKSQKAYKISNDQYQDGEIVRVPLYFTEGFSFLISQK